MREGGRKGGKEEGREGGRKGRERMRVHIAHDSERTTLTSSRTLQNCILLADTLTTAGIRLGDIGQRS